MIPVTLAQEPGSFSEAVRIPGWRSLYEKCGMSAPAPYTRARGAGRPFKQVEIGVVVAGQKVTRKVTRFEDLPGDSFEPYWTEALEDLLREYHRVCAYCCFRIHRSATPSVDHMAPKSRAWDRVYEWDNYRLAALRMNAAKADFTDVIDPFDVRAGWFALDLTLGQVKPGPATVGDSTLHDRVDATIKRLGLNKHGLPEDRMRDIEDYDMGIVRWPRLLVESPFVAAEIERQGKRRTW